MQKRGGDWNLVDLTVIPRGPKLDALLLFEKNMRLLLDTVCTNSILGL